MSDNYLIPFCVVGTILLALFSGLFIFLVIDARKRKNKYYTEKQTLLLANFEEGERMMNQIAKEVHDNIGQIAHLLYMTLDKIEKTAGKETQPKLIDNARNLTDMIIYNADNVSNSLNSDFIKRRGLSNIIQDDVVNIRATGKIYPKFDLTGKVRNFHPDSELLIYRIAQEAMHNTLKHAEASLLMITLNYSDTGFKMEIMDNGIGFKSEMAKQRGIGLANMNERANLLGGDFQIVSKPGSGCSVKLQIDDIITYTNNPNT